jgi:hypothetical protein
MLSLVAYYLLVEVMTMLVVVYAGSYAAAPRVVIGSAMARASLFAVCLAYECIRDHSDAAHKSRHRHQYQHQSHMIDDIEHTGTLESLSPPGRAAAVAAATAAATARAKNDGKLTITVTNADGTPRGNIAFSRPTAAPKIMNGPPSHGRSSSMYTLVDARSPDSTPLVGTEAAADDDALTADDAGTSLLTGASASAGLGADA